MSNETQKPAAKPDGKSVGAMRSWIIIAAAVALFFTFYKTNPGEPAVHELTQTEFYKALEEGNEMFLLVLKTLDKSIQALDEENPEAAEEAIELEQKIDDTEKALRAQHIERLNNGLCIPGAGVVFIDILSNLERVGDHATNLAQMVLEVKKLHK